MRSSEHYVKPGTEVIVHTRNNERATVKQCDSDPHGWDLLVQPATGEPYWTGSSNVTTVDQWDGE